MGHEGWEHAKQEWPPSPDALKTTSQIRVTHYPAPGDLGRPVSVSYCSTPFEPYAGSPFASGVHLSSAPYREYFTNLLADSGGRVTFCVFGGKLSWATGAYAFANAHHMDEVSDGQPLRVRADTWIDPDRHSQRQTLLYAAGHDAIGTGHRLLRLIGDNMGQAYHRVRAYVRPHETAPIEPLPAYDLQRPNNKRYLGSGAIRIAAISQRGSIHVPDYHKVFRSPDSYKVVKRPGGEGGNEWHSVFEAPFSPVALAHPTYWAALLHPDNPTRMRAMLQPAPASDELPYRLLWATYNKEWPFTVAQLHEAPAKVAARELWEGDQPPPNSPPARRKVQIVCEADHPDGPYLAGQLLQMFAAFPLPRGLYITVTAMHPGTGRQRKQPQILQEFVT